MPDDDQPSSNPEVGGDRRRRRPVIEAPTFRPPSLGPPIVEPPTDLSVPGAAVTPRPIAARSGSKPRRKAPSAISGSFTVPHAQGEIRGTGEDHGGSVEDRKQAESAWRAVEEDVRAAAVADRVAADELRRIADDQRTVEEQIQRLTSQTAAAVERNRVLAAEHQAATERAREMATQLREATAAEQRIAGQARPFVAGTSADTTVEESEDAAAAGRSHSGRRITREYGIEDAARRAVEKADAEGEDPEPSRTVPPGFEELDDYEEAGETRETDPTLWAEQPRRGSAGLWVALAAAVTVGGVGLVMFGGVADEPEDGMIGEARMASVFPRGEPSPGTPPPPEPVADPVEDAMRARELLKQAREASLEGNSEDAYQAAAESYGLSPTQPAAQLMVLSACQLGDARRAGRAYSRIKGVKRDQIKSVCATRGIEVD